MSLSAPTSRWQQIFYRWHWLRFIYKNIWPSFIGPRNSEHLEIHPYGAVSIHTTENTAQAVYNGIAGLNVDLSKDLKCIWLFQCTWIFSQEYKEKLLWRVGNHVDLKICVDLVYCAHVLSFMDISAKGGFNLKSSMLQALFRICCRDVECIVHRINDSWAPIQEYIHWKHFLCKQ